MTQEEETEEEDDWDGIEDEDDLEYLLEESTRGETF